MSNRRIFLTHPDPWGNGCSCTLVYFPAYDGPLDGYIGSGWVATYDDGTLVNFNDHGQKNEI